MRARMSLLFERTENVPFIVAIRTGMIMILPVLMLGSFALVFNTLPIPFYQSFITGFFGGVLREIFIAVYNGTIGLLSVFVTVSVSYSYAQQHKARESYVFGAPVTALICFGILAGVLNEGFSVSAFGVLGMFVAFVSAIAAAFLYTRFSKGSTGRTVFYTDGADTIFNKAFASILPVTAVVLIFVIINLLVCHFFHVTSVYNLFSRAANNLFHNMGGGLGSSLLFVFASGFMWFFGIHGGDVLDGVSQGLFVPAMEQNIAAVAAGQLPTEIYTKQFLDTFVLMGGCGTSMCLLLAMLLFSRRKTSRSVSKLAALPMVFNINEAMVFGLPIVYNPFLFIPFLCTPLVLTLTGAAALKLGLVPIPAGDITWTTPVILSGFLLSGWQGALLQLFNLLLGTAIYTPFILLNDREKLSSMHKHLDIIIKRLRESEESNTPIQFTETNDATGSVAKTLAMDLKHAIQTGNGLKLYYQPQYNSGGECIGAEALLRWHHSGCGMMYPPLVIALARETEILTALELAIFRIAAVDSVRMRRKVHPNFKVSVNITAVTLKNPEFLAILTDLWKTEGFDPAHIWLEITEQMAMDIGTETQELLKRIKGMGYHMAIDDFSMGHTSLKYLQSNQFELVKIDGSLVRDILINPNCREIIASMVYLAGSMGFELCAEYVETEEQRKVLENVGCHMYQGYLYSPAIPADDLICRQEQDCLPTQKV